MQTQKAFINHRNDLSQPEHYFGVFLFNNDEKLMEFAIEHIRKFGCDDPAIFKAAFSPLVLSLIDKSSIPSEYEPLLEEDSFYPSNPEIRSWLKSLLSGDIPQAYDKLLNLSDNSYNNWPLCGLALYNFLEARQFNSALALYRMKAKQIPSEKKIFKVVEIRCIFENYGDLSELRQLEKNLEKTKEFEEDARILEIYWRCKILTGRILESEIEKCNLPEVIKHELLTEFYYLKENYSEALRESEQALKIEERWKTKLIKLRIEWKKTENPDDIIDEVRELYSRNPFVADILVFMAEIYLELEEMEYAKQIVDHAVKVNKSRQEFRELQDRIYAKAVGFAFDFKTDYCFPEHSNRRKNR